MRERLYNRCFYIRTVQSNLLKMLGRDADDIFHSTMMHADHGFLTQESIID